jgi:cell division protein FtsQ
MPSSQVKNRRRADEAQRAHEVKRQGALWVRVMLGAALTVGAAVGAHAAYTWALSAPELALHRVSFAGLERASEAELLKLAGLAPGQNLLALDVPLAERAMAAHPWVKAVDVTRHLPHGLEVRVVERVAAAVAPLGELYLVDRQGVPFKRVQPGDAVDLPLVSGVDRDAYVARPEEAAARLCEALDLAEAYVQSPAARGWPLSEVRVADDGLTLVVGKAGQEIHMGEGATAEKLARLARVRAALEGRALVAEVIHLDNRTRPGWVAIKTSDPASERSGAR